MCFHGILRIFRTDLLLFIGFYQIYLKFKFEFKTN